MPTAAHSTRFRWRRHSKWRRVWRRTLGAAVIILAALLFFWGLIGACESTAVIP